MGEIFTEGILKEPTLVLSSRNYTHYGQIFTSDVSFIKKLNAPNELQFSVIKNKYNDYLWDKIADLKLVYLKEIDTYFEIEVSLVDSTDVTKNVFGKSLCESELSQTNLYNIQINTEEDIARDEYVLPTIFYRDTKATELKLSIVLEQIIEQGETPELIAERDTLIKEISDLKGASLLHRILEKAPHYSIGHVDDSLKNLQRSFSIDGTSIYEFLSGNCAEQFDCLFTYDSTTRTINAYDLLPVCNVCGNRNTSYDKCDNSDCLTNTDPDNYRYEPTYYGEETTIYADNENLTDVINLDTNKDNIKNCFRLVAGDDDMTAAIINSNPNGTEYIYYISDEQKADMPEGLVKVIEDYDLLYKSKEDEYKFITERLYECIDHILYYSSSMMPRIDIGNAMTSKDAIALLTAENLSPLSISTLNEYTSQATVESALKNYAKSFVRSGYFKVEVINGEWVPDVIEETEEREVSVQKEITNNNGEVTIITTVEKQEVVVNRTVERGMWHGRFRVINYSDDTDIATSDEDVYVEINKDYETFIVQKIQKYLSMHNDKEGTIYDVLGIKDYDKLCEAITYYSLNRLISFRDAYQGILDIIIELGESDADTSSTIYTEEGKETQTVYEAFYEPYLKKMQACEIEMDKRQATIDQWTSLGVDEAYFFCDKNHPNALRVVADAPIEGISVLRDIVIKTCPDAKVDDYVYKDSEAGYDARVAQRESIQKELNFQRYLESHTPPDEKNYYLQFCAYRREDTYNNSNFISDGLSNAQIFQYAEEFLNLAHKEIIKSSQPQHTITCTLYDLVTIKAFAPFLNKFALGNWLRIRSDGKLFRLRLISYQFKSNDLKNIPVEFADMTRTADGMNDIQAVLSQASAMSSSYAYVSKQASNGNDANAILESFESNGIDSSIFSIKNNVNGELAFGDYGLLARSYDDITDSYTDEQIKLTHNVLAFTSDNWKTVCTALGKQKYKDIDGTIKEAFGLRSDFVISGLVAGSKIIGTEFYGGESNSDGVYPFTVDENGVVTATEGTIGGWILGKDKDNQNVFVSQNGKIILNANAKGKEFAINVNDKFTVTADGDTNQVTGTFGGWTVGLDYLSSGLDGTGIILNSTDGNIAGSYDKIDQTGWNLSSGGEAEFYNATVKGTINATNGYIGTTNNIISSAGFNFVDGYMLLGDTPKYILNKVVNGISYNLFGEVAVGGSLYSIDGYIGGLNIKTNGLFSDNQQTIIDTQTDTIKTKNLIVNEKNILTELDGKIKPEVEYTMTKNTRDGVDYYTFHEVK